MAEERVIRGIYKRGKIYWIRYVDPMGKIIRESSKSGSKKEAEYLLASRRKDVMDGKLPEIKKIKSCIFSELSVDYLEWAKRQKAYKSKFNLVNHLIVKFGNYQLNSFDTRLLEKHQSKLLLMGRCPATVNRHLATIKHMFTKAAQWELVDEGILKKIRKVKQLKENNKRLRYLSKEECKALIGACKPHLKPIVVAALNTGMRKEEILSLEWDKHIDLKHDFILLDVTKNGERREIPINSTLKETLQRLVRRIDSPYVFVDNFGKRFKEVKRSFKSALKLSGIKDFRFHDLRHTFASHLVMARVDITTVRELLGHKTLTMTLRYAHLAPSHKAKAVEILDNVLGEEKFTAQKLHNFKESSISVAG